MVGGWVSLAPTLFFADFPGAGRSWVSPLGPYNEHLVRDVASLNLALAALPPPPRSSGPGARSCAPPG
jgi:hypothetical protein